MRTRIPAILMLVGLSLLMTNRARSSDVHAVATQVPPARPALVLNRGICIDRQFRTIPPEPIMRITREDIRLIKSMGFEFVKLIVNPEPLLSDKGLSDATRWYLREIVQIVVDEGLPVVVCIHPEWKFKERTLSDADSFSRFVAVPGRDRTIPGRQLGTEAVGTAVDDGTRRQRPRLE